MADATPVKADESVKLDRSDDSILDRIWDELGEAQGYTENGNAGSRARGKDRGTRGTSGRNGPGN